MKPQVVDKELILSAYLGILGRKPTVEEVNSWVKTAEHEQLSYAQVLERFATSEEAMQKNGRQIPRDLIAYFIDSILGDKNRYRLQEGIIEAAVRDPNPLLRIARAIAWNPNGAKSILAKAVEPRWVFVHIPKTGGISLLSWLSALFSEDDRIQLERMVTRDHGIDPRIRPLVSTYHLISGHFGFPAIKEVLSNEYKCRYFTVLREPSERVLSTYYFWKSFRTEYVTSELKGTLAEEHIMSTKSTSLSEWIKIASPAVKNEINNAQIRYLTGLWVDQNGYDPIESDPKAVLSLAVENLNHFAAVGTTEDLGPFAIQLAKDMGGSVPEGGLPRHNITLANVDLAPHVHENVSREVVTDEMSTALQQQNFLDYQLYQRVIDAKKG